MPEAEIYARVAATLAETLNVDTKAIHPTSKLQADLGAESIDILEIMFRLEHEFGVEIRDSDLLSPSPVEQGAARTPLGDRCTVEMIAGYVRKKICEMPAS